MKVLLRLLGVFLLPLCLQANSTLPLAPEGRLAASDATGLAQLVTTSTYRENGRIRTRFTFRTVEALRGKFPAYFRVSAPGGIYQGFADADSRLPKLTVQQTYLLFLSIDRGQLGFADGPGGILDSGAPAVASLRKLAATLSAGVDLAAYATDPVSVEYSVTASGLLDQNGLRRFVLPDRGEPIPVYADVSTLPAGISETQAVTALQHALAAWETVCTVRFSYLGKQVFDQSADAFNSGDGLVIRVQFHDNFNSITGINTLGVGGAGYFLNSGGGGTIVGSPFNPIGYGYVVLKHTQLALSNAATLEEVLTHEIGHVIGLAHSSETSGEANATLAGAIMFFQAHADGRGASLTDYDSSTVLKAYPVNTPPFGYDRVLYAVTSYTGTLTHPEVNCVTLAGMDLQGTALTLQVDSQTSSNGSFAVSGQRVTYTPAGYYTDNSASDPATGAFDRLTARLSDGVNLSPFIELRVVGFRADSKPTGAPDGVPDSWMLARFGNAGASSADADPDGDGQSNLKEFLLGTDPNDAASCFKTISYAAGTLTWTSQRFDTYRVQSSTDLVTWTDQRLVTQPDAVTTRSITGLPSVGGSGRIFFRVQRVE